MMLLSCVGFAILLGVKNSVGGSLAGAFIAGMGIYLAVGIGITWLNMLASKIPVTFLAYKMPSNVAGYRKRSAAAGWQQTIGNCGGICVMVSPVSA